MNDVAPPTRSLVLGAVRSWVGRGWLRRLDAALADFVAGRCPSADGPLLLAAALVAQLEGQGHGCLVLQALIDDPAGLLGWPVDGIDALRFVLARMPSDAVGWSRALAASEAVFVDETDTARASRGRDADDGEPFVLADGRFYLRRYWRYERRIVAGLRARARDAADVDVAAARAWIDRLFDASADDTDWQKVATAIAMRSRVAIVTGGPGTGKTFTAARILALLLATAPRPSSLRIALAAPTGKAAARLRQAIGAAFADLRARVGDGLPWDAMTARLGDAKTLHALLGARPGSRRLRHDAAHPLAVDAVLVDEASMVHVEMMDALLAALPPGARLVLLGDRDQLASVEAGAVLGELCRDAEAGRYRRSTIAWVDACAGEAISDAMRDDAGPALAQQTVMLRRGKRYGGAIDTLARAVNAGRADDAVDLLAGADPHVAWRVAATPDAVVDLALRGRDGAAGLDPFVDALRRRPDSLFAEDHDAWVLEVLAAFDRFRVLCAVRDGPWGVVATNASIERALAAEGRLPTGDGWYEGRPVLVLRNDDDARVFNGDVGVALRTSAGDARLRVHFADGASTRSLGVGRLPDVETAFAMTVHKSQGSEFGHALLVLPPEPGRVVTRELLYTGVTRARDALTIVSADGDAMTRAIARTTRRSSGIASMLAAADAADRRGAS